MMNCPKCGAGNKPGAETCRMCAEPLYPSGSADSVATEIYLLPSTNVFPDLKTQVGTMIIREKLLCPSCSAENEEEWSFCQQCGKKLDKLSSQPAGDADVTQDPQPILSENSAGGSQIEKQSSGGGSFSQPEQPASNSDSASAAQPRTVVMPLLPEPLNGPVQQQELATHKEPVKASVMRDAQGLICQCGHASANESAYCSVCGAARPVAETVVMQSLPKPLTGRLQLILDRGDSDVFYDLKDETLIGRRHGDITFAHDGFMSDTHARIVRRGDDYILIDEASRNGIYIRIKEQWKLDQEDYILIGRQVFQFKV